MNNTDIKTTILNYWFEKPIKDHWFSSTPDIDDDILSNYQNLWAKAKAGKLNKLKDSAEGCPALCIILDQFPLNMFRNTPESFSSEQQAVAISKYAIQNKLDESLSNEQVIFLYMPLMHSENIDDQNLSVHCFKKRDLNTHFSNHHRE